MSWRATEEEKLGVSSWVHFFGGGLGAMLGAVITSPLEVVKTRLQAIKHNKQITRKNSLLSIRALAQQEGWMSLYRGLGTHLTGVIPARSMHFFVYGTAKKILSQKFQTDATIIPVISSAAAGATVVTLTQPIWLIKTRLQLQTHYCKDTLYSSPMDAFKIIVRTEGSKALFKGMSASYLGLSETVIQFTIYERAKLNYIKYKKKNYSEVNMTILEFLMLSGGSKLIASFLTYPHEVIRTRLREQRDTMTARYTGPLQGLRLIAKEEGIKGLYAGMGAHLLRVVPNAAILFLTYEITLAYFSSLKRKKSQVLPIKP
jgi:solute carrier family 25 protein 33/36